LIVAKAPAEVIEGEALFFRARTCLCGKRKGRRVSCHR
jgi:hypothetical protein